MKIKEIILENFRSYRTQTRVPISDLTALIGKNDSGKSTILEALDIFFEGGVVKIDKDDACKQGDASNVTIGVVFDGLPADLVLDSNAATTLPNEHLLNSNGNLEIHKTFNCDLATPKHTVSAFCLHPTAEDAGDVLQKSQSQLKTMIKARGLENNCNQNENPSMRHAIYQSFQDLALQECHVTLEKDNGKAIWKSLQNYLPIFALFQSDRPSTDQDPEVQNPMKVAVEQALSQMEADLDAVTAQIQASAQATADRTLVKLKETYPELASVLTPKFKKPPWKNIFKLDLEADDGIPLNKRGSGVRRLVLLSFFQAEAQKRKDEAVVGGALARRVVYAIEEPETSQHPDNQIRIIEALKELAESGSQVILTTHVPGLAKLLPVDCIRHVTTDETTGDTSIEYGEEGVYEHVADALGVLPSPISSSEISLAILLEGKNDIDALKSLIKILVDAGNIDPLEDNKIFWVIGGGDNTLQDWIERKYLDKLNVHQIAIQDSDRSASAVPLSPEKTQWLHNMGQLANLTAFVTRKRNMDNYVHIAAVTRATGGQITFPAGTDEDFVRMPNVLSQQISTIGSQNLQFAATDLEGTPIQGYSASKCKRIIASFIIPQMTANEVLQRGEYFEGGETKNEILEWIEEIRTRTS